MKQDQVINLLSILSSQIAAEFDLEESAVQDLIKETCEDQLGITLTQTAKPEAATNAKSDDASFPTVSEIETMFAPPSKGPQGD